MKPTKNLVLEGRKLQERFKKSLNESEPITARWSSDFETEHKAWKFRVKGNENFFKVADIYSKTFKKLLSAFDHFDAGGELTAADARMMKKYFEDIESLCQMLSSHLMSVKTHAEGSYRVFEKAEKRLKK